MLEPWYEAVEVTFHCNVRRKDKAVSIQNLLLESCDF